MAKIARKITELIGRTPLLELDNYARQQNVGARIIAKLEYFNPAGSVKDRVALEMIESGMAAGNITEDTVLIEPTSGNTGIGLASAAAALGLKLILTMPETMSIERRRIVAALGAEVVLTSGSQGMKGAIAKAEELKAEYGNAVIPQQFENSANPEAHRKTTGPEIWEDTDGQVDIFVACVGTGGTITGIGEYLKRQNPSIQVVAVEPFDSPVLSGGKPGPHKIQGIGAGFVPGILNLKTIDEIIKVKTDEAYEASRAVAGCEGVLVGISSGAALYAAKLLAKKPENTGKNIIVLLPDSGERYLSTELYQTEYED